MDTSIYTDLGLSPNEAKLYDALLTFGGSGVSTMALRAKVHRRNAYDALQRLLEKGLVFEVYGKGETVYQAVEPGKLMELIREKEMKLAGVMPQLTKLFHENRTTEQAYIFKGVEGVKNYMRLALQSESDIYILGAEGAWLDPRVATYTKWFLREAKAKKIKIWALLDDDTKELDAKPSELAHKWKFLPEESNTSATMEIFGDYVVTYTGTLPGKLLDNVTIFVLHSPELAQNYRVWWKMMWDLL